MKNLTLNVLNELLVDTFNDILAIERNALEAGSIKDLSVAEIHTIEAIGMNEGKTMSEVAAQLGITVGTLTTAVANLVKKEYVERKKTQQDRRVVMVILTKKGKIANRIHQKFHYIMIKETIQGLTPEEEQILIKSLDKLNTYFKCKYKLGVKKENKNE